MKTVETAPSAIKKGEKKMKNNKVWKKLLSLCLVGLFMLPMTTFANTKTSVLKGSPKLVNDIVPIFQSYSKLAAKYLVDCDEVHNQRRVSGERLKYCLTIAKDLRDKIIELNKTLDTLVRKIKNAGKWTKELDLEFDKGSFANGLDTESLSLIQQGNGYRTFTIKTIADLPINKVQIDAEVKELEAQIKKNASTNIQFFQPISYEPNAEFGRRGRLKIILKVIKAALDAATYACTFTKICD